MGLLARSSGSLRGPDYDIQPIGGAIQGSRGGPVDQAFVMDEIGVKAAAPPHLRPRGRLR